MLSIGCDTGIIDAPDSASEGVLPQEGCYGDELNFQNGAYCLCVLHATPVPLISITPAIMTLRREERGV